MLIRELIKADFGIDLPITGGRGNSIDDPIIIKRETINNYVSTEYTFIRCLCAGRRVEYKVTKQWLMEHNGRMIDKIQIETIQTTETEIITQLENYYFDITECF